MAAMPSVVLAEPCHRPSALPVAIQEFYTATHTKLTSFRPVLKGSIMCKCTLDAKLSDFESLLQFHNQATPYTVTTHDPPRPRCSKICLHDAPARVCFTQVPSTAPGDLCLHLIRLNTKLKIQFWHLYA